MGSASRSLTLVHRRTSRRYPLHGDLVIGRAAGHLIFEDPKLSSKHCLIRATADGPAIYDLKSRTGVFVNGAHLPTDKACLLKVGNQITVGDQAFDVAADAEEPAAPGVRLALAALAAAALTMTMVLVLAQRDGRRAPVTTTTGDVVRK